MNRNEQVGFVAVGYLCTFVERNKDVGLMSVDHLNVRTVAFHIFTERERHLKVDILLV